MQKQLVLWTAAALLLGAGAGVAGTRLATNRQDDQVLQELRLTREMLSVLAQREAKNGALPALTTIIRAGAAEPALAAEHRPSRDEKPAAQAEPEPTAENWAAFETGDRLVSAALASGRWSNQNERELINLCTKMTRIQVSELRRSLVRAVNQDKLVREENELRE
jgi:hypothetical protein